MVFLSDSDPLHTGYIISHYPRAIKKGVVGGGGTVALLHTVHSLSLHSKQNLQHLLHLVFKVNLEAPVCLGPVTYMLGNMRSQRKNCGQILHHAAVTHLFAKQHK